MTTQPHAKRLCFAMLSATLGFATASLAHAATLNTWEGDVSSAWQIDANWSENDAPNNGDAGQFDVVFDDPTTVANQPDTSGGGPDRDVNTLTFNQAGWTISGAGDEVQFFSNTAPQLTSNGAGVNRIDSGVKGSGAAGDDTTIFTAADNTLVIGSTVQLGANKNGPGTLVVDDGANFDPDGSTVNVNQGTLLINGTFNNNNFGHSTFVNNGATLGGTGSTDQTNRVTYDIRAGGTFNPGGDGTFGDVIGSFEVTNSRGSNDRDSIFTFQTGSTLHIDIDNAGNADHLTFTKSAVNDASDVILDIQTGVTLDLWGTPAFGTEYDLISVVGIDTIYDASPFDTVRLNGNILNPGTDFIATYTATGDDDAFTGGVKITLVPEPSAFAVLTLVGIPLLARQRRR